jgi:hypothetical protein
MRVMFTIAVLLTGIACISRAEAQVCGGDCNRCLVYARGECIKRGADPVCETRKKRCLARQKAPMGPPKPATTAASRPNAARPTNARPNYRSYRPNAGPPPQRVERPAAAPPAPSVVPPTAGPQPAAVPPPPTAAPAPRLVPARVYLRAADIPPPSIGAYGVVALRSKPTPANRDLTRNLCANNQRLGDGILWLFSFRKYRPKKKCRDRYGTSCSCISSKARRAATR